MRSALTLASAVSLTLIGIGQANAAEKSVIGRTISSFALRDHRGKEFTLAETVDKKCVVLVFVGTECPLAKLYAPRLALLATEYDTRGVAFVGIDSNQQDSTTELAAYARQHGVTFPLLKDVGNAVADQLGAARTPEVFVLDAQRVVRYHGRIDDQYGFQDRRVAYQLDEPRRRDLAQAIDEVLADKSVSQAETEVVGCRIGRVRPADPRSEVTYASHVAGILNKNCVFCHRAGQLAPFSLTNYEDAAGWAEMIREVVNEQRMPPWHADPRFGHFANDARLSDQDKELLNGWVEAGAPEGDPTELPEPPNFVEGWQIPEPDVVLYMRAQPYDVPAEGVVDYQRFIVDPGWTEDKWIKAMDPRPGNPAVVHHIVMYLMPPNTPKKGAAGRLRTDWISAYAPGLRQDVLPEGYARYVPAGSKFVFELHYTPNGTAAQDRSYLGIVFADPKTVKKEVAVKNAGNFTFRIPPRSDNHVVNSEYLFKDDSLLLSVSPHMHLRGKAFRYDLRYPDGRLETVLDVPQYDFAWQTTYTFTEPLRLPRGTKMECRGVFDNSDNNLNNPDPSAEVRWGEQTYEEMMFGWFEMALADQDLTQPQPEPIARTREFQKLVEAGGAKVTDQLKQMIGRALVNDDEFKLFCYFLVEQVPQIDRVCITYVEDGKLRASHVEELNGLESTLRGRATSIDADGQFLAKALEAEAPLVCHDLSQAEGSMMKRMSRKGVLSSLHVPVTVEGRRATVNFWSTESDAFPPPAVELLEAIAKLLEKPAEG